MKNILLLLALCFIKTLIAQLPNTDIWIVDMKKTKEGIILQNPVNITNRVGYDNQPAFSPDGNYLLYTSVRDGKQSDIYKYDFKSKVISQFTTTTTSEYSPTFMPDGKNISVVMVEPDSTQRLWQIPIKGGTPKVIMKEVDSIGYHCWLNNDSLALIMITEPPTMEIANIHTQHHQIIATNVGRGMQIVNKEKIMFVSKNSNKEAIINEYYYKNNKTLPLLCYSSKPIMGEDFRFREDIYIGEKDKLMAINCKTKQEIEKFDFSTLGVINITRIAINKEGTKMAIVGEMK